MTGPHEIATVEDLERILDEYPEIRERIRRKLLTDEERELPRIVAQLAEDLRQLTEAVAEGFAQVHREIGELKEGQQRLEEGQQRLEEGQQRLEERQQRLEEGQQRLEEGQQRLEERQERLEEGQQRLEEGQGELGGRQQRLEESQQRLMERFQELYDSHENLRGTVLEQTAARRLLPRITQELRLRRPQIVKSLDMAMPADLLDALDRAAEEDRITMDMAAAVSVTDLIMQGVSRDEATPIYVLTEVSGTLNHHDIARARERAAALETATGQRTLAAVAAVIIPTPQQDQASAAGVSTYLLG
ncbi:MAG: hypothetical protein F4X64_02870 [Chloroflexi bacterium]|nr:hypothetical protein [Chloroflexota bacterium]